MNRRAKNPKVNFVAEFFLGHDESRQKNNSHYPMKKLINDLPLSEKAVLTPTEFAALFGRTYTWAYRQIYAGKVQVLTQLGRMMIPKSEVERLLLDKQVYNGKPTRRSKAPPAVQPVRQEAISAG
jgi:hypothetical protein